MYANEYTNLRIIKVICGIFGLIFMRHFIYIFNILFLINITPANSQCNGYESLCSKKYDEVAYLTTHNAYSSFEDGFYLPNQNLNVSSQLSQGVRAFMLDVYSEDDLLVLYHGVADLGTALFEDVLNEFRTFINENPNEVITLILEDYSSISKLSDALFASGIIEYLYEYDEVYGWPSLQEMIDLDKRIVLFSDNEVQNPPSWFHFLWEHAVETHFSNQSIDDFSCNLNRGDEQNSLFILNHFITNFPLVLSDLELYYEQVEEVNSNPYFINRVYDCALEVDKFPNFITVDFYDVGDCMQVVNIINQLPEYNTKETEEQNMIFPNPSNGLIHLNLADIDIRSPLRITNIQGEEIRADFKLEKINRDFRLNLSSLNKGLYFLQIGDNISPILLIN